MTQGDIQYILNNSEFIKKHLTDDVVKLLFRHSADSELKLLIGQIAARQKIRKKLPEWYLNFDLVFLSGLSLEQSSSEETARLKSKLISGNHLLDITGGMGIDTCYLSRSFDQTTYVEMQPELYEVSRHNLQTLHPQIQTQLGDGIAYLEKSAADVVYADPYRRDSKNRKMVSLSDCTPDVTTILPLLTQSGRTAVIKLSPMLDISIALKELTLVVEIWIISVRNDCKELLFVLNERAKDPITIKTFNLTKEGIQEFIFKREHHKLPSLSEPRKYLYEPNSSILKSAGQDKLAEVFELSKLHPQSHIFTSDTYHPQFPGRKFQTTEILPPFDKKLKKARLNVISRNFHQKADEIEKKLKLLSSENEFLIATKTLNEKAIFITTKLL